MRVRRDAIIITNVVCSRILTLYFGPRRHTGGTASSSVTLSMLADSSNASQGFQALLKDIERICH